jgi:hypothetical protein
MSDDLGVVELKHPIPVAKEGGGTVEVSKLTFGRIKAKHLKLLPDSFIGDEGKIAPRDIIPIIAGIADIPEEAADELDLDDLMEIAEKLESFFGQSLETGKK